MITLEKNGLLLEVAEPSETYRGTRFDHSGVFHRIEYRGKNYAHKWYDTPEDPLRHDNVRGPSEEFLGVVSTAEGLLKIGVGILADVGTPYDWFHTYPVVREGVRSCEISQDCAVFHDLLEGYYRFEKTVRITGEGEFEIEHNLENLGKEPLPVLNYNHNFFTLGVGVVGAGRRITMEREFSGDWREDSVKAVKEGRSLVMTTVMEAGEKSCMTDIRMPGKGYGFTLEGENGLCVEVSCDASLHHAQFWANHRVACMEPFVAAELRPGDSFSWTIRYRLELTETPPGR